jgi:hypothetical protein
MKKIAEEAGTSNVILKSGVMVEQTAVDQNERWAD